MDKISSVPESFYGILQQNPDSALDNTLEQMRNLGYAVLDSGYSVSELQHISAEFNRVRKRYIETYSEIKLKNINEYYSIRALLTHDDDIFLKMALNENLLSVMKRIIKGAFILNQQNGIINPPKELYNQGAWHRDLPYQHFVSSSPLAVNALFCIDDFTFENGATYVLPASHLSESFPSMNYVKKNAIQIQAKAGSFILLDCMLFHAGGFNSTTAERRAVNHVYNIPYFKQQINIPMSMNDRVLSAEAKSILGFNYNEPKSVVDYLSTRKIINSNVSTEVY